MAGLPDVFSAQNRGKATILGETRMPDIFNMELQSRAKAEALKAEEEKLAQQRGKELQDVIKNLQMGNFTPINTTADAYMRQQVDNFLTETSQTLASQGYKVDQKTVFDAQARVKQIEMEHNRLKSFQNSAGQLIQQVAKDADSDNPIYAAGTDEAITQLALNSVQRDENGNYNVGDLEAAEQQMRAILSDPKNINRQSVAKRVADKYQASKTSQIGKQGGFFVETTTEMPFISQYFLTQSADGKVISQPIYNMASPEYGEFMRMSLESDEQLNIVVGADARALVNDPNFRPDLTDDVQRNDAALRQAFNGVMQPQTYVKQDKALTQDWQAREAYRAALAKGGKEEEKLILDRHKTIRAIQTPFGAQGEFDIPNQNAKMALNKLINSNASIGGKKIVSGKFVRAGTTKIDPNTGKPYNYDILELTTTDGKVDINLSSPDVYDTVFGAFESGTAKLKVTPEEFDLQVQKAGMRRDDPVSYAPSMEELKAMTNAQTQLIQKDTEGKYIPKINNKEIVGMKMGDGSIVSAVSYSGKGKDRAVTFQLNSGQENVTYKITDYAGINAFLEDVAETNLTTQPSKSTTPKLSEVAK